MKEKIVILILVLVFLGLIDRLLWSGGDEGDVARVVIKLDYQSLEELSLFVTLENEIAFDRQGDAYTYSEGDISREPDYINLYPNLYATPLVNWEYPSEGKKVCFLTFDDGPSKHTLEILDVLDEKNIKATFFVIGEEITEKNKSILKEISDRGHLIGVHTYRHDYSFVYASVNVFLEDFDLAFQLIEETTGVRPNVYRFPGGSNNTYLKRIRKELVTEMDRRGFTYYDWNVSGNDAVGNPTSYSVKKNISKDLTRYRFPVVLLHDGKVNKVTTKVIDGIIDYVESSGYEFDTIDQREPCHFR